MSCVLIWELSPQFFTCRARLSRSVYFFSYKKYVPRKISCEAESIWSCFTMYNALTVMGNALATASVPYRWYLRAITRLSPYRWVSIAALRIPAPSSRSGARKRWLSHSNRIATWLRKASRQSMNFYQVPRDFVSSCLASDPNLTLKQRFNKTSRYLQRVGAI